MDERATHVFLRDDEAEAMRRCTIAHRLLHFWCAKEAAFKQGTYVTLKQVPLALLRERHDGLDFDGVETLVCEDLVLALTNSTP